MVLNSSSHGQTANQRRYGSFGTSFQDQIKEEEEEQKKRRKERMARGGL